MTAADEVSRMRGFNRFYTATIGVLGEGMHGTEYSLTEGRVVFELAQRDRTEVTDLRRALGLDAGYLSRLLARLDAGGLVSRERSAADARRQVAALTDEGHKLFAILNERANADALAILDRLPSGERDRVLAAMSTIQGAFADPPAPSTVVIRPAGSGDHGWVIQQHGIRYPAEYGWNATIETITAKIVSDYLANRDPSREACWIAELDGTVVGSVYCVRDAEPSDAEPSNEHSDGETARLRLLMVLPQARGHGIGGRLIDECLRFARAAGYRRMVLWTHEELAAARRLYDRAGFHLDSSDTHEDFGRQVVSEYWSREL
jgi:DNA-binding MarR family transcriptional regulator/GNAT superfamily N-acetyltransferase